MKRKRMKRRRPSTAQVREQEAHVTRILAEHDPVGIAFRGSNETEYDLEARAIVARFPEVASLADLHHMVYRIFCGYFSIELAGPAERYELIARDIWQVLNPA